MASIKGSSSGIESGFGDTSFTKVFVGGLAWETQSEMMRQYFEQFGDILEAVVINDNNTGRSKGYGFVTFRDPESAAKACVDPAPVIDGRRANCNLASLGRPRPTFPFVSGHITSQIPYVGGGQTGNVPSIGSYGYQRPFFYNYRQGLLYPSYPAFTTRIQVSSISRCMEQLTHLYIHTIKWVKSLQAVIRLCSLVD